MPEMESQGMLAELVEESTDIPVMHQKLTVLQSVYNNDVETLNLVLASRRVEIQ